MPVLYSFHSSASCPSQRLCLLQPENGEEAQWASLCSEVIPWPTRGLSILCPWVAVGTVVFMVWLTQSSASCPCSEKETQVQLYINWGRFQSFSASYEVSSWGSGYTFSLYKSIRMADTEVRMRQTSPMLSQPSPSLPFLVKGLEIDMTSIYTAVITSRFILHVPIHSSLYLYWLLASTTTFGKQLNHLLLFGTWLIVASFYIPWSLYWKRQKIPFHSLICATYDTDLYNIPSRLSVFQTDFYSVVPHMKVVL